MYFQTDQELHEYLNTHYGDGNAQHREIIIMDGHPNAVIAIVEDPQAATTRLLYDVPTILLNLHNHGMSMDEAVEYFEYNIERSLAYLHHNSPLLQYQPLPQNPVKPKETTKKQASRTKTNTTKTRKHS